MNPVGQSRLMKSSLKEPDPPEDHFRFGENWADFARGLDDDAMRGAEEALARLAGSEALSAKSFLDIGCGSGLHALAALHLGASRVLAVDLDPVSVRTTEAVLGARAPNLGWEARKISVFDLDPDRHSRFDVVYSWGVLHHTGAMYRAIEKAAAMVAPGGLLIIALYRKTPLCRFWMLEKRFYSKAPKALQRLVRFVYLVLFRLAFMLRGRDFGAYVRDYYKNFRGMSFYTDVHDWLGGYPYESVRPREVVDFMNRLGFDLERDFLHPTGIGAFGTGCDEFTFRSRNQRLETKKGDTAAGPYRPLGSQGNRTATSNGPGT